MAVILNGADVRMALMDRRTELIRCASIIKSDCFDEQISDLDKAIADLWDSKEVMLLNRIA